MRAAAMCFSLFQVPRCRIHTCAGSWWESIHKFSMRGRNNSNISLLGPRIYGVEGDHNRRWTRKSVSTNTGRKNILSSKTSKVSQQISDEAISTHNNVNASRVEISDYEEIDIQPKISENKDLSKLSTIIVFDIETTGLSRDNERIIEVAFRDLSGGVNSTFQTLVNPEKSVPNSYIHGISRHMVNKPGIPRMQELIPILLRWVRSRQKPGGQIVFIAHNAKSFDVPFLMHEFIRCSYCIPPDWLFIDTMPLTRELIKIEGSKLSSKSLQALKEYYNIPVTGKAHRAMADVNVLALVLQRMTLDLKLTLTRLVENYTFTAPQLANNAKKKKDST